MGLLGDTCGFWLSRVTMPAGLARSIIHPLHLVPSPHVAAGLGPDCALPTLGLPGPRPSCTSHLFLPDSYRFGSPPSASSPPSVQLPSSLLVNRRASKLFFITSFDYFFKIIFFASGHVICLPPFALHRMAWPLLALSTSPLLSLLHAFLQP